MTRINWSQSDEDILRTYVGKLTVAEMRVNHFPERTDAAIRGKLFRMGLTSGVKARVATTNGVKPRPDRELLEELSNRGFKITKDNLPPVDQTYKMPQLLEPIEIGVVSDSHLCSNYQQLTHLNNFYDFCADRGISTILNAGDISAGNGRVYRGQIYDMFIHGSDATVKYVAKSYPYKKGIKTMMIAGNHDESFLKADGSDVVSRVAKQRMDIDYLGMHGAFVEFGNIKIYLMHPTGGVAYARSYKMQKIIEQMSPQNKPHILLCGHWHTTCHLGMYRNVEGISVGCFEAQTPYLKRKGLYPSISGLVLKIFPNEKGMDGISTHWKYYYEPLEEDY